MPIEYINIPIRLHEIDDRYGKGPIRLLSEKEKSKGKNDMIFLDQESVSINSNIWKIKSVKLNMPENIFYVNCERHFGEDLFYLSLRINDPNLFNGQLILNQGKISITIATTLPAFSGEYIN